jgi:hypothetical protein
LNKKKAGKPHFQPAARPAGPAGACDSVILEENRAYKSSHFCPPYFLSPVIAVCNLSENSQKEA